MTFYVVENYLRLNYHITNEWNYFITLVSIAYDNRHSSNWKNFFIFIKTRIRL